MRSIILLLILVMIGLNGKGQSVTALPDSVLSQCCLEVTLLNGNVTTVDWVFIQYITRDGTGTKLFVEYAPNFGGIQWETQIRIQDDFDDVLQRSKFIVIPFTVGTTDYGINRNWIANIEENTTTGGTWIYGRFGTPTKRKFSAVEDYQTLKNLLLACRPRAIVVAENGLYTEGDTVRMGGFLIENTTITTEGYNFMMKDTISKTEFGLDYLTPETADTTVYWGRRSGSVRQMMQMGNRYWENIMKDTIGGLFSDFIHSWGSGNPFLKYLIFNPLDPNSGSVQLQVQKNNAFLIMSNETTNPYYTPGWIITNNSVQIGVNESGSGDPGNGVLMGAFGDGTSNEYLFLITKNVDNNIATNGQYLQLVDDTNGKVEFATIDLSAYLPIADTANMLRRYFREVGYGILATGSHTIRADTANTTGLATKIFTNRFFLKTDTTAAFASYLKRPVGWGLLLLSGKYPYADSSKLATRYYTGANFFPLQGGTLTGTGGAGFIGFPTQASNPSTPISGFRLFANSAGKLSWKGTNGFVRTFDGTANTADRMYVLPDVDGTLALGTGTTNRVPLWTATNTLGNSNIQDNGTAVSILNSKPFLPGTWTTAGRSTGVAFYQGGNSTTGFWEGYTGSAWENFITSTGASANQVSYFSSAGKIIGNAGLTYSTSGNILTTGIANSTPSQFSVVNTNNSTGSHAQLRATAGTDANRYAEFGKWSSSGTTYKIIKANDTYLFNSFTSGDLDILNDYSSGRIYIYSSLGNIIGAYSTDQILKITSSSTSGSSFLFENTSGTGYTWYMGVGGSSNASPGTWGLYNLQSDYTVFGVNAAQKAATLNATSQLGFATSGAYTVSSPDVGIARKSAGTLWLVNGAATHATSTGGFGIGYGTTTQTPTEFNGLIRMNSDTNTVQIYTGGARYYLSTRAYARSLFQGSVPRMSIGTLVDNAYEAKINGDVYVMDSTRLTTTPAHSSITGLLTRDANGWVGLASLAGGLSYSGGVLSASGVNTIYNSSDSLKNATHLVKMASAQSFGIGKFADVRYPNYSTDFGLNISLDENGYIGLHNQQSYMELRNDLFSGIGSDNGFYSSLFGNGSDFSKVSSSILESGTPTYYTVSKTHNYTTRNIGGGQFPFAANANYATYERSGNTNGTQAVSFNISTPSIKSIVLNYNQIGDTVYYNYMGNGDSIEYSPGGSIPQNRDYGFNTAGTKSYKIGYYKRSTLSNWTELFRVDFLVSNAIKFYDKYRFSDSTPGTGRNVHVWDNGTPSFVEVKRDTTIYVNDSDYDFSAAITTAQIASRYNRVIFLMTTTAAAGSDSELTLHTPDANLMQCEILIRSTDEAGGFDNRVLFGTNNAVSSTNTLASTYYPAAGQGLGIRVGLRSGVYKYFYY